MSEEVVKQFIVLALSVGCAPIVQFIIEEILEYKARKGQAVAPQTKRWLSFLVAGEAASVLYLAGMLMGFWPYSPILHIGAVGVAIAAQQGVHGKKTLLTGGDLEALRHG